MNFAATLRRAAARLGWMGVAGAAGLLLALLLWLALGLQASRERDALRGQVAALQAQLRTTGAGMAPRDDSTPAQLARFYAGFPNVQTASDWLARMQAVARRSQLVLLAGEYRLEQRPGERLQRYAIVLPVRGSYGQIRAFVDGVLADVPSIALDDIEMRRDSAAEAALEARIRFTLYLRAAP